MFCNENSFFSRDHVDFIPWRHVEGVLMETIDLFVINFPRNSRLKSSIGAEEKSHRKEVVLFINSIVL